MFGRFRIASRRFAGSIIPPGPLFLNSANGAVNENTVLAKIITVDISSTFALSGADSARFELSSAGPATSTTLRWVGDGTKNFESPNDTGTNNIYDVVVEATANSQTTTQSNAITVSNLSQPAATSWESSGTSSWKAPAVGTTVTDDGADWLSSTGFDPSFLDLQSDDTTYCIASVIGASQISSTLSVENFQFTTADVPSGATILGIEFQLVTKSSGGSLSQRPNLHYDVIKGGVPLGNDQSISFGTTTEITTVIGSPSDLWGTSWTDAQIRASDFGIAIFSTTGPLGSGTITGSIDLLQCRVTYTIGGGSDPSIASSSTTGTHVASLNKNVADTTLAIIGGSGSTQFELYSNSGVQAIRRSATGTLSAGTYTLQIQDTTNGLGGSEEARTDTLSITVTGSGTYLYIGASNRAGKYKGNKSPDSQFYKGVKTGVFAS